MVSQSGYLKCFLHVTSFEWLKTCLRLDSLNMLLRWVRAKKYAQKLEEEARDQP